ncbi:MAG: metallophosphoesterase [Planctomycetota bacterium]|jgi:predicted MPP superfamily phosphohydrolase
MTVLVFSIFLIGILVIPDALWWWWADRKVRHVRWARVCVALFVVAMGVQALSLIFFRDWALRSHEVLPMAYIASTYLWHLMLLPATLVVILVGEIGARVRRKPDVESRRGFLAGTIALAPPLLTGVGVAISLPRLKDVRLREIDVPVPGLPPALDGMVIAHVSDPHVGKFTVDRSLDRAVELTNSIEADLVLGTGDLIDLSLIDLPRALEFLERIDPRGGHFWCEGNHDLIDDPAGFYLGMADAPTDLLLGTGSVREVRGHRVQVLATRWAHDDRGHADAVAVARSRRDESAFPILLAHHPHVFDHADGFPFVLSGHTHGGQLMLDEQCGAGPVIFRYWSGLYRRPDRSLVVSNGIGHWFPLRTASPAEVLKLTLRGV